MKVIDNTIPIYKEMIINKNKLIKELKEELNLLHKQRIDNEVLFFNKGYDKALKDYDIKEALFE